MILSAILKRAGHDTEVLIAGSKTRREKEVSIANADLMGFYCVSGEEVWLKNFIKPYGKRPPLVLGGPHPTFMPDVIRDVPADFAIRGEADGALLDLIEALGCPTEKLKKIKNLCFLDNGTLHISEQRELVEDLDALPFQDIELYMGYSYLRNYIREYYPVITSRGCPHDCTYCFNKKYKEMHRGKGTYHRRRSPAGVIEELKKVKHDYQVRKFIFVDDSFIVSKPWLGDFSELYKREINIPCICETPASSLDTETVKLLVKMNCTSVKMGLETADEKNRKMLLNKIVTNVQIAEAAALLKKNGIMLQTFNMVGIPGEGLEQALKTMYFNQEIKTDFTLVSFYHNYPGTELYMKSALPSTSISDTEGGSLFTPGSSIGANVRLARIGMLMQLFNVMHLPPILVKIIISLPLTPLFKLIHKISYALSVKKIIGLSWLSFIRVSWQSKKFF